MSESKCRILYVDDHEDSAEILKLLLTPLSYEVTTAFTVDEALRRAQSESFDLYVLDKRLPDGSGIDLCHKLSELTPGVPCIFYTGDAYETHRHQATAAGARAYIPKPNVEALIDAVNKFLADRECAPA